MSTSLSTKEKLDRFAAALEIVLEQALDDGLWFAAQTASEAHLQQELRRLHAVIEGEA